MPTQEREKVETLGLARPLYVASYFGFQPIEPLRIKRVDVEATHECERHPLYDAAEKAAFIRHYIENNLSSTPHPLALSYRKHSTKDLDDYVLHLVGATSGVAEATLIRSVLSILSEEGCDDLGVELNCVGDKDSFSAYERELTNHVRKFSAELPEKVRDVLKEDIFNIFKKEDEELTQLRERVPSSIAFLSLDSRNHFKEVLEFVEALGIEFRLAPELLGERGHSSHTIFAVRSEGKVLATGYRYSRLTKKLGLKRELPMIGATVFLSEIAGKYQKKFYKDTPRARFSLVHLGREAKMRALHLLEMLRRERIYVRHFLGTDKLTNQLPAAENCGVSHIIILGQKEALEGTATVRNISTHAQDTIPLDHLPLYLKNLPI